MAQERKNIVFLFMDQQRADSIGAYRTGAETRSPAHTPTLDGLARRGVRFSRAYTPCTVCSPARASVFTGLYPHQHGVTGNGENLRLDLPNLAGALLRAGYRLGYAGKWHIDDTYGPSHLGFHANDWLGYAHPAGGVYLRSFKNSWHNPINYYVEYLQERGLDIPTLEEVLYRPTSARQFEILARQTGPVEAHYEHYVAEETIALLRRFVQNQGRDGKPFFMWANFWGPHNPYILPEPYFSMFTGADVQLSPSMRETFANKPWVQRAMSVHYQGVDALDDATWREVVAKYAGYCALLDHQTGRILAALEELGVADDTIVVYSCDHGSMVGHHRLIDKGPEPYEDIVHIPLMVAGPGIAQGCVCDEFAYLHDLTPTILEWAGAEPFPCATNIQSLAPALAGGRLAQPRDDVYMTRHHHPFPYEQRFLRTDRFKYAFNAFDTDELYDLQADPDEMTNLSDDPRYAAAKEELRERMRRHIRALKDPIAACFNTWTNTPPPKA